MSLFKVDGKSYNVAVKSLKRTFQVLDGENAGRNLNGEMIRDVIGTYYNYSVEIARKEASPEEYDSLYEVISSTDDFHTFEMPYGQSVYTFKGYVSNGSDELRRIENNKKIWGNLAFNMIAKVPKRRPL